jgi:hypothetical protein
LLYFYDEDDFDIITIQQFKVLHMGFKIGLLGRQNSGKSFGRTTIPDGENVMVIAASIKASYLTDSNKRPVGMLDIKGNKFNGWEEAKQYLGVKTHRGVINKLYPTEVGKMKRHNLPGNMAICTQLSHIPDWMTFIDRHMPWIHTIILPDFTHYVSAIISDQVFIDKRAGNEAYQKFWELAADSLKGFVSCADLVRPDLIVITEYHTEYNTEEGCYEMFTSGGKMLKEKFLPTSYYDILLGTHIDYNEAGEASRYYYVTRQTKKYPDARSMGILGNDLLIPNDLQLVLTRVRQTQGIPVTYSEPLLKTSQ